MLILVFGRIPEAANPTGHHDILVDEAYKEIGCAFTKKADADEFYVNQGIWVCDLHS